MNDPALLLFRFHTLIKYLYISLNHNRAVSTLPYIGFPRKIQYSSIYSFVMIPRSTISSGHLMNISTFISGCRNASSTSNILVTHPSSLCYKVIPMRILVDLSDTTGENDSVKSNPGTYMYPLTTFNGFRRINLSGSSLLLKFPFNRYWISTFFFHGASLSRNPCLY